MNPSQLVESYKFWEVAALWAAECVESELLVARALAWLQATGQALPAFWFAAKERAVSP